MVDFWLVALLAGSGQGYATTEIVFNLMSVVVFVALGMALWVLADR